ncbi:hypothetical protein [Streptomyces sp. NPDC094466]|uniref:hypothetical protein n=1 Tax=Streptomyces sp. NPDC094466 TaxID=3366065 RepID=UPI0037F634FE
MALALGRVQGGEWFLELVAHEDSVVCLLVDVQRREESLIQPAALLVVAAPVERLRIFEELQACLDDLPSHSEILVGGVQSLGEAFPLPRDVAQLGSDCALRQAAVGSQIDEVGLLGVEGAKLFRELGMEELGRGLLLVNHDGQLGAHG